MRILSKNIYLDIDGVILTRGGIPALHLTEFLRHILNNYSVFWLTSRCRGDSKYTVDYLSKFVPVEIIPLISKIKPTNFGIDKTEAIDFKKDFFWFDDDLFDSEKRVLVGHGKYNSWIEINLIKNPDQLHDLINSMLRYSKEPSPIFKASMSMVGSGQILR